MYKEVIYMAIDRSLVSGSMGMMILRLLTEKDMYGYEMIDTLKKRSENVFELNTLSAASRTGRKAVCHVL